MSDIRRLHRECHDTPRFSGKAAAAKAEDHEALVAATTAVIRRLVAILNSPKPQAPEVSP